MYSNKSQKKSHTFQSFSPPVSFPPLSYVWQRVTTVHHKEVTVTKSWQFEISNKHWLKQCLKLEQVSDWIEFIYANPSAV